MSYMYYKAFRQQKSPSNAIKVITIMQFDSPYVIFYLSSIVTMALSCTVSEILSFISGNLKTSRVRDHAHSRNSL